LSVDNRFVVNLSDLVFLSGGTMGKSTTFASRSEAGRYAAEQRWKGHLADSERRFEAMSPDEWDAMHQQAIGLFDDLLGDAKAVGDLPKNADGRNSTVLAAYYVSKYISLGYRAMNDYLRGGNPDDWANDFRQTFDQETGAATDRLVKEFDQLALPMPKDTFVYRGLGMAQDRQIKVGDVYEDDAFMSTSASRGVANDFRSDWTEESVKYTYPVVMKIRLPKGYKAIVPGLRGVRDEQEVLLRPKSKLRVVEIKDVFKELANGDTYRVGSEWVLEVVE